MPRAGLKAAALLLLIFLLIAGTASAASFHDLKKQAALQKIRPELLQAIKPQKSGANAPPGSAPLGGRTAPNAAIAKAVKVKNGKIKVLLNLENSNQLDSLGKAVEAKGGKISGKFAAGKAIAAELPLEKILEIAEETGVASIWPDFEVTSLEEPLQQINADFAQGIGLRGEGIRIAVLDTGIDETHPALAGKVVAAENFSDSTTASDVFGHGTHVAGIIAGNPYGVAPNARLLNAKVLNDSGSGTASGVIAGINWAIGQGADVINLSLGAPIADTDTPLNQAVRDAIAQGVVVAVASGNCGSGCASGGCGGFAGVTMPGNTAEAITVGAVDSGNNRACFSGGGIINNEIKPDVSAPGVGIVSSVPGGTAAKSGTSMATPFAAGAAALAMQKHPEFSAQQVKQFLERTALDLGAQGEDMDYGWGLLDLSKVESDLNFSGGDGEWHPPDGGSGSDVNFFESEFTFSGPDTVFKKTAGNFSVWHAGTGGQEIGSAAENDIDTIVEFAVSDEFGNVVDRRFEGPKEYSGFLSLSFDYSWIPERTGNFTVRATVYKEGIAGSGMQPSGVESASVERQVKATVPGDMLGIDLFSAPLSVQQGSDANFSIRVTNNGYLETEIAAEVLLLDDYNNVFKIISGAPDGNKSGGTEVRPSTIALYRFDDGSGAFAADAAEKQAPLNVSEEGWTTVGKLGSHAYNLAGAYHANNTSLLDTMPPEDGELSISMWIKPNADFFSAGRQVLLMKRNNSGPQNDIYLFFTSGGGTLRMTVNNDVSAGNDCYADCSLEWAADTWYNLLFTWGSRGIRIYRDGALCASRDDTGKPAGYCTRLMGNKTTASASEKFLLGWDGSGIESRKFNGTIDELLIESADLNATPAAAATLRITENPELVAPGEEREIKIGSLLDLPAGSYKAAAIVHFEDKNIRAEKDLNIYFPAGGMLQNMNIPASVEANGELPGTIEFANGTDLAAQPLLFGEILDGNETVGSIFIDGNSVAPHSTAQYAFFWKADAAPGNYTLRFEARYNGNVATTEGQFDITDTTAPTINSISIKNSLTQNQFNPIAVNAFDTTGVSVVSAAITGPTGAAYPLNLNQIGFDRNSEWSIAFAETGETGNYTLQITACDAYNNCAQSAPMQFSAAPAPLLCNGKNLLLVAGDSGFSLDQNGQQWLEKIAQERSCTQLWKKSLHGNPGQRYLQKFDAVIWSAGNRFGESIDSNDSQMLVDFVRGGGSLLLEGSDIASEHIADELMQEIAHATWNSEPGSDANSSTIRFNATGFLNTLGSKQFDLNKAPFFDTLAEAQAGKALASFEGAPVMTFDQNAESGSKAVFSAIALSAFGENDRDTLLTKAISWLFESTAPGGILHLAEMPSYKKEKPYYSGAAVAEMILDYTRASAGYSDVNQDQVYAYGRGLNGNDLNADSMDAVLGHFDPYDSNVHNYLDAYDSLRDGNPYQGYNYTVDTYDPNKSPGAINDYMRDIAHWMAYPVTKEAWWLHGTLVAEPNTPAALPIFGDYNHWVALNGFAASENPCPYPQTNPWFVPDFTIYGFWLTDPAIDGIGEHAYVTADDANSMYFKPMQTNDKYNGKYLQIAEPPAIPPEETLGEIETETSAKAKIAEPAADKANLEFIGIETTAITQQAATGIAATENQTAPAAKMKKQNWKDMVDPHLLSDENAAAAFEGTKMGKPVLVKRTDNNTTYYLVPFKKTLKIKTGKKTTALTGATGVIMLDTSDGHFKQAAWAQQPQEYLPVTKEKAIRLVEAAIKKEGNKAKFGKAAAELAWQPNAYSESPFKPYWVIGLNGEKWAVTQEGKTARMASAQLAQPALQCPATPIGKDYAFQWAPGDYSAIYLQFGYNSAFAAGTFFQVAGTASPTGIKSSYSTLKTYATKSPTKTIFSRIYAKDAYGGAAYSNKCEFGIKG